MATPPRPLVVSGSVTSTPSRPALLSDRRRGTEASAASTFLPEELFEAKVTVDLRRPTRDAAGIVVAQPVEAGDVVVLELEGGVTVITSGDRLQDYLDRFRDPDGDEMPDLAQVMRSRLDQGTDRGIVEAAGALLRLTTLVVKAPDAILNAARDELSKILGQQLKEKAAERIEFGATWLGTRVLMRAVESRLDKPGLCRWEGVGDRHATLTQVGPEDLAPEVSKGAFLLFIHGTGSSTNGSFSDLKRTAPADWRALAARYEDRILAFEHRTFSESPIENALELAKSLPDGAVVDVVTHSRGGLVGDFLSLGAFDVDLIDAHFGERRAARKAVAADAYASHRSALRELREVLARKKLRVDRYVRVASPARGTRLAGENLDAFLSGLLTLVGLVPVLQASPIYAALKRIVIEIARNRMKPEVVPGIEAMLPDSPVGAFLTRVPPAEGLRLAVIAGDIEGGGLLKRLGVLFTDTVFFDGVNNDLVVDTDSMYAGLARPGQARFRFEQGPDVNHFRYFENRPSRLALCEWLATGDGAAVEALSSFAPLPSAPAERTVAQDLEREKTRAATRGAPANAPIVIVLPGIMGSHLDKGGDHVWLDPLDIAAGGLEKLSWTGFDDDVRAQKLFDRFYGDLCDHLAATHRVERFPYDWRKTVETAAGQLAERVKRLLKDTEAARPPIRFLAHSMGGLVVRAMIALHPDVWEAVNRRGDTRFVMLGTPNQGSHSMVSTLLGKDDTVRKLARFVDMKHDLQELLDIIKGFRGALQLLPRPGFVDTAGNAAQMADYYNAGLWPTFKAQNRDFWFGNGIVGAPDAQAVAEARGLWTKLDDLAKGRLPDQHRDRIVYVCGQSPSTPCGVTLENGRWKILVTAQGDGTVTWKSGLIEGLADDRNVFYLRAEHGAMPSTDSAFPALVDLLQTGDTQRRDQLSRSPSVSREAGPDLRSVDAGPVPCPTAEEMLDALAGRRRTRLPVSRKPAVLNVSVTAMDLRNTVRPVMVGHYDRDAISGAEAVIDRAVLQGELSLRHHLGLYAGRLGTASVILTAQSQQEIARGSSLGAVVVGLGELGELTLESLTEAVRAGVLRYLMQLVDNESVCGKPIPENIPLASLLLGYNSTTSISIEASVGAIVRGTLEANHQFAARTQRPLRVTDLEFVELYLDAAISATKALRRVAERLNEDASRFGMRVVAASELKQLKGWRHRLDAQVSSAYWQRIIVTQADRPEGNESGAQPIDPAQKTPPRDATLPVAEKLKFVFIGQRARAESLFQQRQPGLVERLMEQAITGSGPQRDFSRTLFQVLVPHDFKETARQLDRLVLVVDGYTANLPWELMVADDEPLAVRMAMVRQFTTGSFRVRVRPTLDRCAYVIGNPPTDGFDKVFPDAGVTSLRFLDGAVAEAKSVIDVLARHDFAPENIERSIGEIRWEGQAADDPADTVPSPDPRPVDIVNKLYRRNYRIVHIAAHGIHDAVGADGHARTGVVLGDGIMITAAEIEAMEIVPDLVFLNCCHLGKINARPNAYNRLAYSLARKLMEIGVRAVIVAGWAVDDEAARQFAEVFYEQWLGAKQPFGEAVYLARTAVYRAHAGRCNTWGAFQAYGDPGLQFDPQNDGRSSGVSRWQPAAPEELVQQLESLRSDIAREGRVASGSEGQQARRDGERLLNQAPAGWRDRPDVLFAWGRLLGDLGPAHFDAARDAYLAALRASDMDRYVPTRAVEELANLEARSGHKQGDAGRIEGALARLDHLAQAVMPDGTHPNAEHAALVGSAAKRLAELYGKRVLEGSSDAKSVGEALSRCVRCLEESAKAYRASSGEPGTAAFKPYLALNALGLEAARGILDFARGDAPWDGDSASNRERIELIRACVAQANAEFSRNPDVWNAVMPADAAVVTALLDRTLAEPGEAGEAAFRQLRAAYEGALEGVRATPRERDSVATQLHLLSLILQVAGCALKRPSAIPPADAAERIEIASRRLDALEARITGGTKAQNAPVPRTGERETGDGGRADAEPATDLTSTATRLAGKRTSTRKASVKTPSTRKTPKAPSTKGAATKPRKR